MKAAQATYLLTLYGPLDVRTPIDDVLQIRNVGLSDQYLRELKENIDDILPKGWYVQIRPAQCPE